MFVIHYNHIYCIKNHLQDVTMKNTLVYKVSGRNIFIVNILYIDILNLHVKILRFKLY